MPWARGALMWEQGWGALLEHISLLLCATCDLDGGLLLVLFTVTERTLLSGEGVVTVARGSWLEYFVVSL